MQPWDTPVMGEYCEGRTHPYLVGNVYELFSFIAASYLVCVGFFGMLQPHLEVMHKLLYSSVCISGVGSMLLHSMPIHVFQYAARFPFSFTLCFAILNIFEDCVNEYVRREKSDQANGEKTSKNRAFCGFSFIKRGSTFRITLYNAFVLTLGGVYIVTGSILIVFSREFFTFNVVEIYYAVPYMLITILGLNYLTVSDHVAPGVDSSLRKLKYATIISSFLAFVFRSIDAFACTPLSIWFFPHPIYLILEGYTFHTLIVFLSYAAATRDVYDEDSLPEVWWKFLVPRITINPKGRLGKTGAGSINYS